MTRATAAVACYPWQTLSLAIAIAACTGGALVGFGALTIDHVGLALWSVAVGLVLAGVWEVGVIQLGVRIFHAAQSWIWTHAR
jgi:hypothetical protein